MQVNRTDLKRQLSICYAYSKDLAVAGKIDKTETFSFAEQIYKWLEVTTDKILIEANRVKPIDKGV